MAAVLTLRNLERVLIPSAHPAILETDEVMELIRRNMASEQYGNEEMARSEALSLSQDKDDCVLLVELLLSKHPKSQLKWVQLQLGRKNAVDNSEVREFLAFALSVVEGPIRWKGK